MKDFRDTIILLLPLLVFISCSKDSQTIVHGRVVDKVTGKGLDSVGLTLYVYFKRNGVEKKFDEVIVTDSAGYFSYEHSDRFTIFSAIRYGYLEKGVGTRVAEIKAGAVNDVIIPMVPLDGTVLLKAENINNAFDSIQIVATCPEALEEVELSDGNIYALPITALPIGNSYEKYFKVPTGGNLTFYWSHSYFHVPIVTPPPYMATVAVSRNDTTVFSIEY